MSDIRYKWQKGENSVGLGDFKLPQFKVAGHRQQDKVINLTTGEY
ncbi:gamma-aminobutyric acid receptor subunit beta-like protein [Leptotrombidium deliense]|uniref:Gamma-aminobutyric acid receptor subunit beta-like protein n=1 Tax=Leptotrombidium deliense TaxID=299467 RepID=A0A443S9E6_9ACAR|nr:gamma-aminobutyric acid receptor subunit beta-like protein [Leptotrombidium deliense]